MRDCSRSAQIAELGTMRALELTCHAQSLQRFNCCDFLEGAPR